MARRGSSKSFFQVIVIQIVSSVVVVICIVDVWTGCEIVWISKCFTITVIIVVPRVGRVAVKSLWPQHDFVNVVHTIFIIIDVDVITISVVIMVECLCEGNCKLNVVWYTVAVPIIVSPVNNTIVVVIPCGLLFAPETTCNQLLISIKNTVVVIVRVFTIRNTIVVVIDVVHCWLKKP